MIKRCDWAKNELAIAYHDNEWCVPSHDEAVLFEFLTLEGAQAGLSWDTILRKRENYRDLFAQFDPRKVARFTPARIEKILSNPGIVRNRQKVVSTVNNAKALLRIQNEFGSFDSYIWRFVDGKPVRGKWQRTAQMPATTPLSDAISKDLRGRGFSFVGSTICYSFMQAVGLVDDHIITCFKSRT